MSFTTEVKAQIAANELHPCCMKAELTAVSCGNTAVRHKKDEAEKKQYLCDPCEKQGDGNSS